VAKGKVIRQSPEADVQLEKGKHVAITVSKGPAPVAVPSVRGTTAAEAKATLEALGFTVVQTSKFSDSVAKGKAIGTDPPAGSKEDKGSEVTLIVSKGPESFKMLEVIGMKTGDAKKKLEGLGLNVHESKLGDPFDGTVVQLQSPDPGTTVHVGDTVTIWS
jgi:beta-lactam-binding protein with PASTA domain